ncbi:protein of unknown function DUF632 [Macleaya cordata]|uniref:DUF632 domain-containing protein n=1 Tax=Macleaya cordata TaxID=56857 RepID=A0A200QKE0_MACCD|nr:protein of unknown function DUF632 [Macleaya cordata]
MGCTSSKLDDLPAVALCRDRCYFLDEAIRQRYALADSHVAYIQSLKGFGISLDRFFDHQDLDNFTSSSSPVLPLPSQRKGDPSSTSSPPPVVSFHSHSNSGSMADNGYMTMNYMKNRSTPSVVYEQRPMSPETVNFGESSSSSFNPYSYPNYDNNSSSSYAYYNYPPPVYSNYGGGMAGFFGSSPQYGSFSPPPQNSMASSSASSSKPPPPPPSPPRASAWDFLNPFSTFEKYYPPQTPSRDSKEVREEEGIPDLEDEDFQHEVVKEVHVDEKFADASGGNVSNKNAGNEDERGNDGEAVYQARNSVPAENREYEVHLVDKNVVDKEELSKEQGNVAAFRGRVGFRSVSEVVREIKAQFERASDSGIEVSKILEAGKLPYNRKNAVYQVSSKMLHSMTPPLSVVSSQPSTSKSAESSSSTEKDGSIFLGFDEGVGRALVNLSSTLQQLYIWEKKLYEEVKAEEKMRLIHDRKCRRLKRLDEKGAEAHKVDSTRTLVRTLSTKIRIAIQVVDKISVKINKLRDEELWPKINELIHGLIRMWAIMLECHRNQCQAIAEAKNLDAIAFNRKFNDTHLEATVQLELELLNWILRFSSWVLAQKAFVRALNSWLLKCLLNEPEETPDGIAPFSPGRIGAPPVFVICNQWSQAMERISEKEVLDTMRVFAASVHHLCEQHNMELRQRMTANRDLERRVKAIEREEQKMLKALQVVDKQMVQLSGQGSGLAVPGQMVQPSDTTNIVSLQSGLKRIFEAMERFMASSRQAYEELRVIGEEDRLRRENANVT